MSKFSKAVAQNSPRSMGQPQDQWVVDVCWWSLYPQGAKIDWNKSVSNTSMLNVEGKIFFSVMVSHLTKYLTENGHINASVQNGGTSTISGCLEHATMIWEAILRAKSEKLNFDVIWLDLANNCGSVPHQMIQLALRLYHVPEDIQVSDARWLFQPFPDEVLHK